jgi:hypothetical protein
MQANRLHTWSCVACLRWYQVLESMQSASLMLVTIPFALGATLPDAHSNQGWSGVALVAMHA